MKRRKTIRAGRLVWDITYTVPRPNASKQERKRIREVTEEQIQRTNANTAQRKLEQLMACNFDEGDLVLTVTYRDADLPDSADVTRKHLGKVFCADAGLPQGARSAGSEIHLCARGQARRPPASRAYYCQCHRR